VFVGTQDQHQLGFSVDGAGDVNGDGFEDLVVGEPWPVFGAAGPGHAYVYSGADGSLLYTFDGSAPGDQFRSGVAGVGDLNDDGRDDIAVGAPGPAGISFQTPGRLVVFSGADGSALLIVDGWQSFMRLGAAVKAFLDRDGDGTQDMLVGAPAYG